MSTAFAEQHVISNDGTRIGLLVLGSGPALVFVHGGLTTGDEWRPVAAALANRFSCCIMTRRGRGRSGDGASYSLDKECEDIRSVVNAMGGRVHVVAHSYGAVCALETARQSAMDALILYEPPLPVDGPVVGPAFAAFRDAVGRRQLDEALTIMLRDLVHLNADQLAALRRTPLWNDMAALTPPTVRECEALTGLELGVQRYERIVAPTLLLVGTDTAPEHRRRSIALERALPNARTVFLQGHGHEAHVFAPDLVAETIADFLRASSSRAPR